MKKIVINNCYGGFSLSPAGTRRYAELKGKECYFFTNPTFREYIPTTEEKIGDSMFWSAFTVPNPQTIPTENWFELSLEEKKAHNERFGEVSLYSRDFPRDDVHLIQVVEELGEKANGRCAYLKIVEIPDDVEWEIEEYDGNEWIAEKHQTWS